MQLSCPTWYHWAHTLEHVIFADHPHSPTEAVDAFNVTPNHSVLLELQFSCCWEWLHLLS